MATKKSAKHTKVALPPQIPERNDMNVVPVSSSPKSAIPLSRIAITVVLVLLLIGVVAARKGLLFAAMVNGKPIFRWDLSNVLMSRYGTQTLEGMISEKLIDDAAQKEGVNVSKSDMDTKTNQLVKSLGGSVDIDQVLKIQGMTRADFDKQLKMQLTVEKIVGKGLTITDNDADMFIATNRAQLTATTEADMRSEAKTMLLEKEVQEKFQSWFTDLKAKAQIVRFLQ
jgi:hypothetical protein